MRQNNRKLGAFYEQDAGEYLKSQGYEIVVYNYRCRSGEIDIIARDGEYLVFCEVKYRKNLWKGTPAEAVTITKQRALSKTAAFYIMKHGLWDAPCRFDVVAIVGEGEKRQIELIKNAFDYAD